jgi:unsaturated rhamnogalacturonyl hydrolase
VTLSSAQARQAAQHIHRYPFKRWGFGEDVALRALLEFGAHVQDGAHVAFVDDLVRGWCRGRRALQPADHVAPGAVLLEVAARHADEEVFAVAGLLAELLVSFPVRSGVRVHRTDLPPHTTTIWVDCMALDGPFLAGYGRATGEGRWADAAEAAVLSYAAALRDPTSGLHHHGFFVDRQVTNGIAWGRGNGWALHGMLDTWEALPTAHPGRERIAALVAGTIAAVAQLQHPSGFWHTVLTDPTTPLESSTAAFFASGFLKAARLGLAPTVADAGVDVAAVAASAQSALARVVDADGALAISAATPAGDRATYALQTTGVFPWGQGPLLLAYLEAERAAVRGVAP